MINFKTKRLGDFLNFQRGFDLLSKERLNGKIPDISSGESVSDVTRNVAYVLVQVL